MRSSSLLGVLAGRAAMNMLSRYQPQWPEISHKCLSSTCGAFTSSIVGGEPAAHIGDQRLEERPALGMPEDRARPFLLEMEEVHLARELAMVAPLRLLELLEIGVELLLLRERRGVDARQHRLRRIAAPIGARDLHQLERVADLAGRGHVRAAAEVGPLALAVELDLLIGGNRVDQLDLERLALLLEKALRLVAARRRFW